MNAREARVRFHCTISLSLIARSISRRIWQQQQKLNAKTPRWQATDFLLLFNIMHLYCIITFFPYCTRMAPKLKKIEYTKFSGDIWYSFVYIINVYIRSWTMMTCKRHSSAKKKERGNNAYFLISPLAITLFAASSSSLFFRAPVRSFHFWHNEWGNNLCNNFAFEHALCRVQAAECVCAGGHVRMHQNGTDANNCCGKKNEKNSIIQWHSLVSL